MKKYYDFFAEEPKEKRGRFKNFLNSLTKKQLISICLVLSILTFNIVYASVNGSNAILKQSFQTLEKILNENDLAPSFPDIDNPQATIAALQGNFVSVMFLVDVLKNTMSYISEVQAQSVETLAKIDFGGEDMFNHITAGLTIFAVIGCLYKLLMHFLRTERLDSVRAYTGYFSYIGMFLLFIFSGQIVDKVVSLNKPLTKDSVNQIFVKIDDELNKNIQADFKKGLEEIQKIDMEYKKLGNWDLADKISNKMQKISIKMWDLGLKFFFKYCYYSFFALIITIVLAIPAFSISFMVKILLGVMVAGAKLVFLISFIPGFENTWKTYMLNLLNVILWIPIFNQIIVFLGQIIGFTINDNSIETGQIIWLTIVVVVGAFQSISLTTASASTIINGAGASIAGAMGGLASMNAASMVAGAGQAAMGAGITLATGGTSAGTLKASEKFFK